MRYVNSYRVNKNVFSLFLNVSSEMSGVRSSAETAGKTVPHTRSLDSKETIAVKKVFQAPKAWNCQPHDIRLEVCTNSFKRKLKAFSFKRYYCLSYRTF